MPKPKRKAKRKTGRPTKYDPDRSPDLARALANIGHTEKTIARLMHTTTVTLAAWKNKYPLFLDALKGGKAPVDDSVEKTLLQRALGYEFEETHAVARRVQYTDENGNEQTRMETVEVKKIKKERAPDVTACIFWLKNRRPKLWRDVQRQELTGADGSTLPLLSFATVMQKAEREGFGKPDIIDHAEKG